MQRWGPERLPATANTISWPTACRGKNEAPKAVELLTQALELCEKSGDEDSKASTLCNLGAALMQVIAALAGWARALLRIGARGRVVPCPQGGGLGAVNALFHKQLSCVSRLLHSAGGHGEGTGLPQ
jgi:hypothetical protein